MSQGQFDGRATIEVLHVDDDEAFAEMVSTFLERTDRLDVTTVTDPREALDRLEAVDCIVSDYQMPEIDGLELLTRVRDRDPELPFILFTGQGSETVAEQAFSAGASEYLQKEGGTSQYQVLSNRIETVVDRYYAEQQADRVQEINHVAHEVNKALVRATSRTELEERVCETLSRSDLYGYAAIGEPDSGDGSISPRYCAGDVDVSFEEFDSHSDKQIDADLHPGSGENRSTAVVCGDDCRSKQIVPLEYRGTNYGVLCVCDDTAGSSGGFERRLIERLADDIAHAIDGLETTAKLRAERNRLRAIYEASPDLLLVFDSDGSYERTVSDGTGLLTDDEGDSEGQPIETYATVETNERIEAACERTHRTGTYQRIEFPLEFDDRTRWYEGHTAPLEHHVTEDRVLMIVREITEQKQREGRLRTFERAIEEAGHSIYITDVDATIEYVNPAFEEITGYSADEAIGRTPRILQSGEHDEEFYRDLWRTLLDGEVWKSDIVNRRKDGEHYRANQTIAPIENESGDIEKFVAVNTDISEQVARKQRFEAIFNRTFEFIGLLEPDGTLVEANDTALEFGGFDREDVLGDPFWEAPWWQTAAARSELREAIDRAAAGEFVRYETEVCGEEGTATIDFSLRPITDDRGEVTLIVPEGRLITELKRREKQLETLNESIRSLLDAETRTEVADRGVEIARETLGLELIAIHLYDEFAEGLIPVAVTDDGEEFLDSIPTFTEGDSIAWRVYESGDAVAIDDVTEVPDVYNPETDVRSELVVPLEGHGVLLAGSEAPEAFDPSDVTTGEVLAGHIVAALEQVDTERELRGREQTLKARNDRLDAFTRTVSHDLRGPLNLAFNTLETYQESDDEEHLDRIEDALNRMQNLIDDLLRLARSGRDIDKLYSTDLGRIAATAWTYVDTADASLDIEETATIAADADRLQRLFENLFRNAVEHGSTSPHSQVREDAVEHGSTSPHSQARGDAVEHGENTVTVRVGLLDDGFYVEDDGRGVPDDVADRIFDAGFSSTPDGTGYGLSIVRSIADAHGWDVSLDRHSSDGARFEIRGVELLDR